MNNYQVLLLPGDGIGPEITKATQVVLEALAELQGFGFSFREALIGGCAIDQTGEALPAATLEAAKHAQAILLGAVGGPKWDAPQAKVRPEQGLLGIRKALGLYANLRPVKVWSGFDGASPLKPEYAQGVDLLVVRELTGGLYFGMPKGTERQSDGSERAVDTMVYTTQEIERVTRTAFDIARSRRKHVTSVDKANVLESSRLWRRTVTRVAEEYPDVTLSHQLVDSTAMRLISAAKEFDVILTENLFGDILSDEAGVLAGSLGLLPSASLAEGTMGLYEPVHGSAPDIAGRDIANPIGTLLSAALMLRLSLGETQAATVLERAVARTLESGLRTADIAGKGSVPCGTRAFSEAVIKHLK